MPFDASKLVTSSRYSILHERYDKPSKRSALLLSHTPKHGLLLDIQFTPRFVEKAFWQWYYNTTLSVHARVALRLDVAIWLVCCCVVGVRSWYLLYTILCVFISAVVARIHDKHNAWYKKHARALTTLKRLLTFPNIKLMPSRGVQSPGMWQMVLVHIILRSGAIYNAIQPFYYTNYWLLCAYLTLRAVTCCCRLSAGCSSTPTTHPVPATNDRGADATLVKAPVFDGSQHTCVSCPMCSRWQMSFPADVLSHLISVCSCGALSSCSVPLQLFSYSSMPGLAGSTATCSGYCPATACSSFGCSSRRSFS